MTRRYTNPRLPYLTLHRNQQWTLLFHNISVWYRAVKDTQAIVAIFKFFLLFAFRQEIPPKVATGSKPLTSGLTKQYRAPVDRRPETNRPSSEFRWKTVLERRNGLDEGRGRRQLDCRVVVRGDTRLIGTETQNEIRYTQSACRLPGARHFSRWRRLTSCGRCPLSAGRFPAAMKREMGPGRDIGKPVRATVDHTVRSFTVTDVYTPCPQKN